MSESMSDLIECRRLIRSDIGPWAQCHGERGERGERRGAPGHVLLHVPIIAEARCDIIAR
jgi:hypothetical protein